MTLKNLRLIRAAWSGVFIGLALIGAAYAANNYRISNPGGVTTTLKSTDTAGVHVPHVNVDTVAASASLFPAGAIPITTSATGTTLATAATLAAGATTTTYICGFSVRANATAAATAQSTVAGTITGTLNFLQFTAPLASGIGVTEQVFTPCVPASAVNTTIVITSAAPGAGGNVSVSAWGYRQ